MKNRLLAAAVLAGLAIGVYLPFVGNGFLYDDFLIVLSPQPPRSVGAVVDLLGDSYYPTLTYYRPFTMATFQIQRTLLGDAPGSFHAMNLLLIALAAWMAYLLLSLPGFGLGRTAALWAATAFAVHPVSSSCVFPVSGRDTLLASLFVLASLYSLCRGGRASYAAGVGLFALALLSKEMSVVLPALLLAADLTGVSASPPGRKALRWVTRYAPIALVMLGYVLVRRALFAGFDYPPGNVGDFALSFVYALQVVLAPFEELRYEPTIAGWFSWWRTALALLLVLGVTMACRVRWQPVRGPVAFWIAWFCITLLPTANLVWQETRFAERYVFFSSLGLIGLLATTASSVPPRIIGRRVRVAIGSVVVLAFSVLSYARGAHWEEEAFYRQWIAHNPEHVTAHYNFGRVLDQRGKIEESIALYEETLRLDPEHGEAHNNLGTVLVKRREIERAVEHFREALRLDPQNYKAHNNLGSALAIEGRMDEAERHFRASLEGEPGYKNAHTNLGHALLLRGDLEGAESHFRAALRADPLFVDAHSGLGATLTRMGRAAEGERHLAEAKRLSEEPAP